MGFSLPDFSWMAWTWPTAAFFIVIALLLIGMGVWEYAVPGGNPRIGILRFETTRGDGFSFRCSAAPLSILPGLVSRDQASGGLSLSPLSTPSAYSVTCEAN